MMADVSSSQDQEAPPQYSPREFFRSRRPEQFSDSEIVLSYTREQLDFHIENLTSRMAESDFEIFGRYLAQRELCPNLRPMTGPVGGGDSKVDAGSYPVAEAISSRVYWGNARPQTTERWAFAFSAKKKWTDKARSDFRAAAGTSPKPAVVYFVTSRYARDKTRDSIQIEMSKELGVRAEILDRTWILDRVFGGNHHDLVQKHLHMHVSITEHKTGSADLAREAELVEVKDILNHTEKYSLTPYELCEYMIDAAILCRELEKPKFETYSVLSQARNFADTHRHNGQMIRARYQQAWTSYFWHEDYDMTLGMLEELKPLAKNAQSAHELDYIVRIRNILLAGSRTGTLAAVQAVSDASWLAVELNRIASEAKTKPGSAAFARALLLTMEMSEAPDMDSLCSIAARLIDLLVEARQYKSFPFIQHLKVLEDLQVSFAQRPELDEHYEKYEELCQSHADDTNTARIRLRRGSALLRAKRYREAISLLASSAYLLGRESTQNEGIRAAILCGAAYAEHGLLWAARASYLHALNYATSGVDTEPVWPQEGLVALRQLLLTELVLGRVPAALSCIRVLQGIDPEFPVTWTEKSPPSSDSNDTEAPPDLILALHFLRAPFEHIHVSIKLKALLESRGCYLSLAALEFIAGHSDSDFHATCGGEEKAEEFMNNLARQPFAAQVYPIPYLGVEGSPAKFSATVLGMDICVSFETSAIGCALAEDLVTALEVFMATLSLEHLAPFKSQVEIHLRPTSGLLQALDVPHTPSATGQITVGHTTDPAGLPTSYDCPEYREEITKVLAWTLTHFAPASGSSLTSALDRSDAVHRAFSLIPLNIFSTHLFTGDFGYTLTPWIADEEDHAIVRSAPWTPSEPPPPTDRQRPNPDAKPYDTAHHRHLIVDNAIDVELWNRAVWRGIMYAAPPVFIGLIFEDGDAASQILEGWHSLPSTDIIRISLFYKTDNRGLVTSYRILIGPDISKLTPQTSSFMANIVARIHDSECSDPVNFKGFLKNFQDAQQIYVSALAYSGGSPVPIDIDPVKIHNFVAVGPSDFEVLDHNSLEFAHGSVWFTAGDDDE